MIICGFCHVEYVSKSVGESVVFSPRCKCSEILRKLERAKETIVNVKRCKQQPCCQCMEAIDKYLGVEK